MSLQIQLLKEIDVLILYAILSTRGNKARTEDIKKTIKSFYPKLYNKPTPTYSYFYQRVNRLRELFFVEKQGARTFRVRRDSYDQINEYVSAFMKARFDIKNNEYLSE